ncbi:type II toxin-antitoxin system RelE/ParE family toxin [Marivirga sp.]|uniref:type II toxin-antitoxin system RelE/ParE family toxin n=1 Tax=Marivirga sp. TaxID=2018662 RepID=UPI0025FC2281|nr:type II toxin-antitoxin system RelE/ParE family toxin [Marivirga sp.]
MAGRVIWTHTARNQRKDILEFWYLRTGNKKYSRKISKYIKRKIKHLAKYSYLGKPTDYQNVRVISDGNFSIFYKLSDVNILIVSLWDNRQDPRKIEKYL